MHILYTTCTYVRTLTHTRTRTQCGYECNSCCGCVYPFTISIESGALHSTECVLVGNNTEQNGHCWFKYVRTLYSVHMLLMYFILTHRNIKYITIKFSYINRALNVRTLCIYSAGHKCNTHDEFSYKMEVFKMKYICKNVFANFCLMEYLRWFFKRNTQFWKLFSLLN